MSQQQTVRITTTETTTSTALTINSGYLKTPPGLLKILQFVRTTQFFFLIVVHFEDDNIFSNYEFFPI